MCQTSHKSYKKLNFQCDNQILKYSQYEDSCWAFIVAYFITNVSCYRVIVQFSGALNQTTLVEEVFRSFIYI